MMIKKLENYNNSPPMAKSITQFNFKQKNPVLFTFISRFLLCYFLWEISFYVIWHNSTLLNSYRNLSLWIINCILDSTNSALHLLQYQTELDYGNRIIRLVSTGGVTVGEPCIGYGVMAIFSALIISYPKHLQQKLWFLPLGLVIIYIANIIRIMVLAITVEINPNIWEFNHKFFFKIIVYTIVFILWDQWIKLARRLKEKSPE